MDKLQFSDYFQSSSGDVKLVEGGKPLFKLKLKLNSTIYTKVIMTRGKPLFKLKLKLNSTIYTKVIMSPPWWKEGSHCSS